MPIKFLYSLFCLLTGVLSAMSSRAAGPGVINLLPSDYRAANKNWAVAEDDAALPASVLPLSYHAVTGRSSFCHVFHFLWIQFLFATQTTTTLLRK